MSVLLLIFSRMVVARMLKISFSFLFFFGFLVLLFYFFWNFYDKKELSKEKTNSYTFSSKEKGKIHDGDIILRRGFGMVSDYIVNLFNEEYKVSHCGIICKSADSLFVIHSESSSYFTFEGVQSQNFDDYVASSHQNSVIIVRFNNCETSNLHKISKRGLYYLGTKVPFDYSFNMNDSTEMYCAEIIWHVFKDVFQTDIYKFEGQEVNYSQFSNFWDSTYFDVILNHQAKK